MSINRDKLNKKNTLKIGCVTVSKSDGYIHIATERTISHKSIKLQESQYQFGYEQGVELKVIYTIPKNFLEKKYQPIINDMLQKRKVNSSSIKNISKKKSKKIEPQKNAKITNENTERKKKVLRDNGSIIRDARINSFRMCENCDYYSSRQGRCGLFYREVKPSNVCSRFNYTKFRIYSGGGFSPR